jgi:hypothetical protein
VQHVEPFIFLASFPTRAAAASSRAFHDRAATSLVSSILKARWAANLPLVANLSKVTDYSPTATEALRYLEENLPVGWPTKFLTKQTLAAAIFGPLSQPLLGRLSPPLQPYLVRRSADRLPLGRQQF